MNKEPVVLYIFRFLLAFFLFAFMLMLYWSSNVQEKKLIDLNNNLKDLNKEISTLHQDIKNIPLQTSSFDFKVSKTSERKHIDKSLPNLLVEDHFYRETLPKMLGKTFLPRGNLRTAFPGKVENLHPFSNYAEVSEWNSLCSVSVAKLQFGKYEIYSPDMAVKVEERRNGNKTEFWVHLRENVYWQPLNRKHFPVGFELSEHFFKKHQVTAHDFKFYFDAITNPHFAGSAVFRTYFGDIEEFRIIDDLTFVVRWNHNEVSLNNGKKKFVQKYKAKNLTFGLSPLPCFVYKYFADGSKIIEDDLDPNTYQNNSIWAQNFSEHWAKNVIVSCGPWVFDGMDDVSIRFRRNPDFYNPYAALTEKKEIFFKKSIDAVWIAFKSGKIDLQELPPDKIMAYERFINTEDYANQVKQGMAIKKLNYLDARFDYIGWNQNNALFKDRKVRRALTLAIDRNRIIEQILNDRGIEITGPSSTAYPSYDSSIKPYPYDIKRAKFLLEEAGWYDFDGDGILEKEIDGNIVPFKFSITYYVGNTIAKSICEYISTNLKQLGILVSLNGVDVADLSRSLEESSFDALCMAWGLAAPPDDHKQIWHSSGLKQSGSSNRIGFANKEVDEIIDKLHYENDKEKRIKLYHRFHAIIHDEVPYTFLFTPKRSLLYREYVKNVFVPRDHQDLIPGAEVFFPVSSVFWLDEDTKDRE